MEKKPPHNRRNKLSKKIRALTVQLESNCTVYLRIDLFTLRMKTLETEGFPKVKNQTKAIFDPQGLSERVNR